MALICKKEGVKYTSDELSAKTLANLKAICDGLSIAYTEEDTVETLKVKIVV